MCERGREDGFVERAEGGSGQVTDFMFIVQIAKTLAAFFKKRSFAQ